MTKELSKAIMIRNKLQCHFLEKKKKGHHKLNQNIASKETYVSAGLENLKWIITKALIWMI